MNPVVHFEMPYEDRRRMADFYSKVFGWKPQMLGPEMGEYVVEITAETDDKGRPKNPGTINGGFFKRAAEPSGQHPSVVVSVADIRDAVNKVKTAGGKVLGEPTDIPGVGLYVGFVDTEGNRVSILQPSAQRMPH